MKKTAILILATVLISSCGCKKETTKPVEPTPVTQTIDSTLFEMVVTSNFTQTQSSFDNLTTGNTVMFLTVPTTFRFWARPDKAYLCRSYSSKNSTDSTMFMTDNKHIWNKMTLRNVKENKLVYDHTDSVGSAGWCIVSNSIKINY